MFERRRIRNLFLKRLVIVVAMIFVPIAWFAFPNIAAGTPSIRFIAFSFCILVPYEFFMAICCKYADVKMY